VADEKGTVSAWERGSGAPAWKNEDFTGRRLIGAIAAAGMVVTGDLQGYVHWLDRTDGKVVARAATDGSSINQQALFLGDGVLVLTRKGGLYAFPMP
jgi:outer membrane protein assembly factor BamB